MNAANVPHNGARRGASLLLAHCDALGGGRQPAHVRLAAILGNELAGRLVTALAGSHPPRFAEPGA
jgi:hypothetical protein